MKEKTNQWNIEKPQEIEQNYFENPEKIKEINAELKVVSDEIMEKHWQIESFVGEKFLTIYGKYLRPEQQRYMLAHMAVIINPERAVSFLKKREEENHFNARVSGVDGFFYQGYSIEHEIGEEDNFESMGDQEDLEGTLLYKGKTVLIIMPDDFLDIEIDSNLIMDEKEFDASSGSRVWDLIKPYVLSKELGSLYLHEKTHALQNPELPLPIREAAAYFYDREVFKKNNWGERGIHNMKLFADLYQECVEEIGDDLHRFMFDNLQNQEIREELLTKLKEKFNSQKIEEMSKHKEYDWWENKQDWVYWKRTSVLEVERKILEDKNNL